MEGVWTLGVAAVLAAMIAVVAYEVHVTSCANTTYSGGVEFCLPNDVLGTLAQLLVQYNLYTYGLAVLPALAGAFIGCPLVAREIENGTHRLAWTQGVTRLRWLSVKLVLLSIPLLVAAAVGGVMEVVLINQLGPSVDRWAFFDQQAPMTIAATFFALALGVATGAVIGRSIPAMAATLFIFVVVRIGLAEIGRPIYMAPLTYTQHDMANYSFPPRGYTNAWWVDQASFYDSGGHLLGRGFVGGSVQPAYAIQHFQPGDRFWTFQGIETAILCILAVALIGFAIYWATRRVS
ncbi:MAG TPA: ABC transporter permease subunit [Candidatus Dormibacteraeota bacterium]|nr:ABC transporter permease subunit [Candidatus Dormibacteraeota bacterium]